MNIEQLKNRIKNLSKERAMISARYPSLIDLAKAGRKEIRYADEDALYKADMAIAEVLNDLETKKQIAIAQHNQMIMDSDVLPKALISYD